MHVNKTMHKVTDDVASDNINLSTSSRAGIIQWADITIKDASVPHGRQPESAVVAFPSREDIFMCVLAQTGADRRWQQRDFDKKSVKTENSSDLSMLFPGMILLVGHKVLREERDADARRCKLGKDDARFFQSVLMIYTWKSCITLIHVLVLIKNMCGSTQTLHHHHV